MTVSRGKTAHARTARGQLPRLQGLYCAVSTASLTRTIVRFGHSIVLRNYLLKSPSCSKDIDSRKQRQIGGSQNCEGGADVISVVTPLRGVAQAVLHGDQVVELSVLLGVHQEGEVEEDGEGQVEVEREEDEVKERRSCVTMG